MAELDERLTAWADAARRKVRDGGVSEADIDELLAGVRQSRERQSRERQARRQVRQRVLYLNAVLPSMRAEVISGALHEPVDGPGPQIDPLAPELPYDTVFAAVRDGWRVVQFPDQRAPFDDREIDVLGYEFILEKLEAYDD